jgi:hypothetical protein
MVALLFPTSKKHLLGLRDRNHDQTAIPLTGNHRQVKVLPTSLGLTIMALSACPGINCLAPNCDAAVKFDGRFKDELPERADFRESIRITAYATRFIASSS